MGGLLTVDLLIADLKQAVRMVQVYQNRQIKNVR